MKNRICSSAPLIVVLTAFSLYGLIQAQSKTPENIPIRFYGRVIDQNSRPVIGANVIVQVVISHFAENGTEQEKMTAETDQEGLFTVTAPKGHAVDVLTIEKPGYELSKKRSLSFSYTFPGGFNPDPNNRVVFKMWKKQGTERLIASSWRGKLACDGTSAEFDLLRGNRIKGGNLRITCDLKPTELKWGNRKLSDYKLGVEMIGGGIQKTADEFTYLAPESGYSAKVTIEQKAADPNHREPELRQDFYVKTSDGHYGTLSIEWSAWQIPPTIFIWNCSINPSGSRNLERW